MEPKFIFQLKNLTQYAKRYMNQQPVSKFLLNLIDAFPIPIKQNSDNFQENLSHELNRYVEYLSSNFVNKHLLKKDSELLENVKVLVASIEKTIDDFLNGDLSTYSTIFDSLKEAGIQEYSQELKIFPGDLFFRLSPFDISKELYKERIFHVPFEKRDLIKNQRFSISGYPSLYFGDELMGCFKELEINEKTYANKYIGSVFVNKRPLSCIKLYRPEDFYKRYGDSKFLGNFSNYLTLFPLLIGSLFEVYHKDGDIKPEYILPQILMSYIREVSNIDGIMYPSTRVDYAKIKGWPPYNYAFPAQVPIRFGYCKNLTDKFFWTNPVVLGNQSQFEDRFLPNEIRNLMDYSQIEVEGKYTDYSKTLYATIASNLFTEEFLREKKLAENPCETFFPSDKK